MIGASVGAFDQGALDTITDKVLSFGIATTKDSIYYTQPGLAEFYVEKLILFAPENAVFLEPAAGAGAFVIPLVNRGRDVTAIDINPVDEATFRRDFLEDDDFWPKEKPLVILGNPPFGFASNNAIRFFNRAAEKADIIAFILPRTFRKCSVIEQLNPHFGLKKDEDVPPFSFIKDNKPHDVPCAWQIWERRKKPRQPVLTPDVSHLIEYTDKEKEADFVVRRVGGRAGQVFDPTGNHSESSNYFIKEVKEGIRAVFDGLDWSYVRNQTAGVRSVSKREIALEISKHGG